MVQVCLCNFPLSQCKLDIYMYNATQPLSPRVMNYWYYYSIVGRGSKYVLVFFPYLNVIVTNEQLEDKELGKLMR